MAMQNIVRQVKPGPPTLQKVGSSAKLTKREKQLTMVSVDSIRARFLQSSKMRKLAKAKRQISLFLVFFTVSSIIFMCAEVSTRLDDGSMSVIDGLRGANLAFTLLSLGLLIMYYRAHVMLIYAIQAPLGFAQCVIPLLECIVLMVGVIPPGVETTIPLKLMHDATTMAYMDLTEDELPDRIHVDALGVLMFLRIPLVIKWVVAFKLIASPVLLEWQHDVRVTEFFRAKYLFARMPALMVSIMWTCAWLCGAFCLYVFEHQFRPSFTLWFFVGYDIVSGLGKEPAPQTVPGVVTSTLMNLAGIFGIALITAVFCSGSELNATEVKLIDKIEQQRARHLQKKTATAFLRQSLRMWRMKGRRNLREAKMMREGSKRSLYPVSAVAERMERVKYIRAARKFRSTNLMARNHFTEVANIVVLMSELKMLRAQTAKMQEDQLKVQNLMRKLVGEPSVAAEGWKKSVDTLRRSARQQAEAETNEAASLPDSSPPSAEPK